LLLVAFNIFSQPSNASYLISTLAVYWGTFLKFITPFFIAIEAISSLLVAQSLGQEGKRLAGKSEAWQLGLLISSATSYVGGGYWIIKVCVLHDSDLMFLTLVPVVPRCGCLAIHLEPIRVYIDQLPLAYLYVCGFTRQFTRLTISIVIGFNLRRTNVVESSVLLLYLAFNMWLSTFDRGSSQEIPIINQYVPSEVIFKLQDGV
jgi:hypothetical protein